MFGLDDDKKRDKYYGHGDWDKVIEIGLKQLKTAPYDIKVLHDLAVAYHKKEMDEEAFKMCQRINSFQPEPDITKQSMTLGLRFMRYHLVMAELYYKKGEHQKALDLFQKLKPLGKHFSDKFKFSAKIYLERNDLQSAVSELQSMFKLCDHRIKTVKREIDALVKTHPYDVGAQRLLYDIHKSQETLKSAVRDLEKEASGKTADQSCILTLAYFNHFSGDSAKAIKTLANLKEQGAAGPELELAMANMLFDKGDHESAAQKFLALGRSKPELRPIVLERLLKIINLGRASDDAVMSTAQILEESGNIEAARRIVEPLASKGSGQHVYASYLGKLAAKEVDKAFQRGDLERAGQALKRLLDYDPANESAKKKLAEIESVLDRKKIEEREELLRRGTLSAEQTAALSTELAELYLSKPGLEEKAISLLQNAAKLKTPGLPKALLRLGNIFLSRDLADLALKNYERAASCDMPEQEKKETLYAIAASLEEKNLFQKAKAYYAQVAEIDAGFKDVMKKLDTLAASAPAEERNTMASSASVGPSLGGRYSQVTKIGEGGMGSVYKVFDLILKRPVALKVIREELRRDEEAVQRFLREAQSASQLQHPGITTIYDIIVGDNLTIVMEFVDGQNLRSLLKKGRFSSELTLKLALKICDPLIYAHSHGIVHRDIKPDNIMIPKAGGVKIADFGLAHFAATTALTRAGEALGTPWYMSPEQISGKPVDQRSDIYSLGAMLYEFLTSKVPFPDGNVAYRQVHEAPASPRSLLPTIPISLEKIIMRCLEKDPDRRYPSAKEMKADLSAALS